MENILSKKFKRIARDFLISLIFFLIVFAILGNKTKIKTDYIENFIKSKIQNVEDQLKSMVDVFEERVRLIDLKNWKLNSFKENECLVLIEKGNIKKYSGNLYYFKKLPVSIGGFYLIQKKKKIFYVKRISNNHYFIKFMFRLDEFNRHNKDDVIGLGSNIKHYSDRIQKSTIDSRIKTINKEGDRVNYCEAVLNYSNSQLLYDLELSGFQLSKHNERNKRILFLVLLIIFFIVHIVLRLRIKYRDKKNSFMHNIIIYFSFFSIFPVLFALIKSLDQKTMYLKTSVIQINSVFHMLIISIFVFFVIYFSLRRKKLKPITGTVFFIFSLAIVGSVVKEIIKSVLFPFYRFILLPQYLVLIITLLFLYFIPFLFLRKIEFTKLKRTQIFSQIMLLFSCVFYLNTISSLIITFVAVIFLLQIFKNKTFLKEFVIIFVIAVAISTFFMTESRKQKNEYISQSLQTVFISQNNYAKFILRSIVTEIEYSNYSYHEFFEKDMEFELKRIWESSLAAEENVPSCIIVLPTKESGDLEKKYFYQMEYYRKERPAQFPFWVIEDKTHEINNKQITYAVASRKIYEEGKYFGDIVIQVINSPELILRFQEEDNIFTNDNKINGKDISYIKFDRQNHIIENPGNIDVLLENFPESGWFGFDFSNSKYFGFKFGDQGNTILIYYPQLTLFTVLANYIKIIIFLLGLYYLFNLGIINKLKLKDFYYSFSFKVFAILIFLSVFTVAIFSIFSVNFTSDLIDKNFNNELLKKGRITQNSVFEVLNNKGDLSRKFLFNLSKILNQEISVYKLEENYQLLFVSNYKMETNNEIPIIIPFEDLEKLNSNDEKITIIEKSDNLKLIFQVKEYIFVIIIFKDKSVIFHQRKQYLDFIISLIFILGLMGLTAALIFRKKILTPIEDLNEGMYEVEKGKLINLKNIPTETDLKRLYVGFNKMVKGIKEQRQKISEMSKLKTVIKLGRRVAHEVKNPLTPIKLSAEQIEQSIIDKNPGYENLIKNSVKYIVDETEHLKKVSYGFLNLSKIDELKKENFNISEFLKEQYLKFSLSYSKTEFMYDDKAGKREVFWDKLKIEEILNNIISNSIDAIPTDRKGKIAISSCENNSGEIVITISDNGIGITKKDINEIFKENYSKKDIGTGLGLFISKRIANMHSGEIFISSIPDKETIVKIILPIKC